MADQTTRSEIIVILQAHIEGLRSSAAIFEQQRIASIAASRESAAQRDAASERADRLAAELDALLAEIGEPPAAGPDVDADGSEATA